jgi:hypothetical protein
MEIDIKLIVSILAILISIASLLVSVNNSRFTQRVKGVELRSSLLMKLVEVRSHISEAREYLIQVKIEAEQNNNLSLYKLVNREEFYERLREKIDLQYKKVESTDPSIGVKLYEAIFHDLHDVQKDLESNRRTLENMVKNHKKISPNLDGA